MSKEERHSNHLVGETSPYLLQHASNPVDWYPWGDNAFDKARSEEKPVFLSVGYSTCHWCHVMERESFENDAIAAVLNRSFVAVKVDREEYPDIDRIYMSYVQAVTGRGGWPMSVWLTPDRKPFYGGSYFPPEDRFGLPGFLSLLLSIAEAWKERRGRLLHAADSMFDKLAAISVSASAPSPITGKTFSDAAAFFARSFDDSCGGFGDAPKFPQPAILDFLLAYSFYSGDISARKMALFTLQRLHAGGIHDHLGARGMGGGGFCRYSTDRRWHVPHFEKMLYDNAQLATTFIDAFRISGDFSFAGTAEDILNYVLFDMTGSEGGFFSAEDADSLPGIGSKAKKEGCYYLWTLQEVEAVLDRPERDLFCYVYGVKEEGNVRDDPHGEFEGQNVLMIEHDPDTAAETFGIPPDKARQFLLSAKRKLFDARQLRPRPDRDDKILTSWNGLMISAFCKAYGALGNRLYLETAEKAAAFILENLVRREDGRLLRRYRNGRSGIEARADDYAFFIRALLDLHGITFESRYLAAAASFMDTQISLFFDEVSGGFYSTPSNDPSVPIRMKEDYDGAEPSPNSVSLANLWRLAELTDRNDLRQIAEKTMSSFSEILNSGGFRLPAMLCSAMPLHYGIRRVTLTGVPRSAALQRFQKLLGTMYLPDTVVMHTISGSGSEAALHAAGAGNEVAAHVCAKNTCHLPVTDPENLKELLDHTGGRFTA
ncbi:MAG: thioredoxin domain-containing protein [Chlorobiaceae bacterium]|nr:thioredoxin domain-containing protein [Chlorobiaceae bacterium]NTV59807.1 thioredoxin domain-containing protein [Chlorobiaceae bacterium]